MEKVTNSVARIYIRNCVLSLSFSLSKTKGVRGDISHSMKQLLLDDAQHYGASLTEHCTCRNCGSNKQQVTATKDGSTHEV